MAYPALNTDSVWEMTYQNRKKGERVWVLSEGRKGEGGIMIQTESVYREPERQQNARPFGSSMAERQRIGCLDTWPCNCKQTPSLRFPIRFKYGFPRVFQRLTACWLG